MEGVGGVIAKKEKNTSTIFQGKEKNQKKKDHCYVWMCLNKGRDGFFSP